MNKHDQKMIEKYWDEAHEKMLESVLVDNEELRQLFETYPERKELYKFKILDSEVLEAPTSPTDICCKSCSFQLSPITIGEEMTSRTIGVNVECLI